MGAGAPQEGHFPISQTFFPKPDMGPEINFKEADDTGEAQKCPKGVGVSGAGGDGWCGDVRGGDSQNFSSCNVWARIRFEWHPPGCEQVPPGENYVSVCFYVGARASEHFQNSSRQNFEVLCPPPITLLALLIQYP